MRILSNVAGFDCIVNMNLSLTCCFNEFRLKPEKKKGRKLLDITHKNRYRFKTLHIIKHRLNHNEALIMRNIKVRIALYI